MLGAAKVGCCSISLEAQPLLMKLLRGIRYFPESAVLSLLCLRLLRWSWCVPTILQRDSRTVALTRFVQLAWSASAVACALKASSKCNITLPRPRWTFRWIMNDLRRDCAPDCTRQIYRLLIGLFPLHVVLRIFLDRVRRYLHELYLPTSPVSLFTSSFPSTLYSIRVRPEPFVCDHHLFWCPMPDVTCWANEHCTYDY